MDFAMQLNTPPSNHSVPSGPPADAGKLIRAWRHRAGLTQEGGCPLVELQERVQA